MEKLRNRPEVWIALFLIGLTLLCTTVMLLTYMHALPFVQNY